MTMTRPRISTTNPWLAGTPYKGAAIRRVEGERGRVTRDVVIGQKKVRVPVPVLQDMLLVEKGYEPKYSGKTLEEIQKLKAG